jgi:hypothetical protein
MALVEGWWKKKAKKNKLKKDKPRYYILVSDHLDWYNKPVCQKKENLVCVLQLDSHFQGSDRTGSIPLDRLYIRISPDKNSLVVGDQGTNNEYTLTSDGHDNASMNVSISQCVGFFLFVAVV